MNEDVIGIETYVSKLEKKRLINTLLLINLKKYLDHLVKPKN